MKIIQVFNNNIALVDLGQGRNAVAKGLGIAFKKKKGDEIPSDKIENMFYLESEASKKNLYFLLKDIPIDVVTTTYEIIDVAQKKYHLKVLDYIYITLSDHIYGAYKRFKDGTYTDSMVPDFHETYPTEYLVASEALEIINSNLEIDLPKSEIKNLILHFINALGDSETEADFERNDETRITEIVQKVLKKNGIFRSNSNENYYDRFMIHLKYLVDRLQSYPRKDDLTLPKIKDDLESNYPESYKIATEIYDEIKSEVNSKISNDERIYFIIHIQRLITELPISND